MSAEDLNKSDSFFETQTEEIIELTETELFKLNYEAYLLGQRFGAIVYTATLFMSIVAAFWWRHRND